MEKKPKHLWMSLPALIVAVVLALPFFVGAGEERDVGGNGPQVSDHFNGTVYFNPWVVESAPGGQQSRGRWLWRWIFGAEWPDWPTVEGESPGAAPPERVSVGGLRVTAVGHSTFLIQMDGLNMLTDPIWSDRASPLSWIGPKRHTQPGIRFEDLPPIDLVLISHNHYDHLDLPTLRNLAKKGVPRAIVPLGNRDLVLGTGISSVDEMDWWQSVSVSPDMTVTLVPAQHFSSRGLWDRNKTLWGGFVVSGPSGNVYYAGDTGYAPHFREIARRFSPIRVALLPISPFRPDQGNSGTSGGSMMHMGPEEAVQAHIDLGAEKSIAAHYQVFQLGADGYFDAVNGLASALEKRDLKPETFLALGPGRIMEAATAAGVSDPLKSRVSVRATDEDHKRPSLTFPATSSPGYGLPLSGSTQ